MSEKKVYAIARSGVCSDTRDEVKALLTSYWSRHDKRYARKVRRKMAKKIDYVLGHSEREIWRLRNQAIILRPITKRLLRNSAICEGMRVLDVGCGAGDVSLLAAELVGPTGFVMGIDRSPDVLAVAAERARVAGIGHIKFETSSAETFSSDQSFDLVVGRYVLMHQSDPIGFLRAAAHQVRPGGYIAFHEIRMMQAFESSPPVPLWDLTGDFIKAACRSGLPHYDVGDRLIDCFSKAGLPQPELFCETPIGGGIDSPLYHWVAETLRSFLPQLEKMRVISGASIDIDTLESRLRRTVVNASSQITVPPQVCAWARI